MIKKKKWWIPGCLLIVLLLLIIGGITYMSANSLSFSVGRFLDTNGSYMLILDESPIHLFSNTNNPHLFADLSDGDKVLVLHDGINETYPGNTCVHAILKLEDGSITDIQDDILTQLTALGWYTEKQ